MSYQDELKLAIELVYQGGEIALPYCINRKDQSSLHIEVKQDQSPLTIADTTLNALITSQLSQQFPGYRVIGEESGIKIENDLGIGYSFYVDPIDGTKEFISNNGEWSIIIGLAKDGVPVMGVVYQPVFDILVYAAAGDGAYCITGKGSKPVRLICNDSDDSKKWVNVISRSHSMKKENDFIETIGIQRSYPCGSFGIKCVHIAQGKADIYVNFSGKTSYWDACGPHVILKESGGSGVMNFETKKELKYDGLSTSIKMPILSSTMKIWKHISKL
jgi:3'(2'), 5'-bisphosphate nucleotidase